MSIADVVSRVSELEGLAVRSVTPTVAPPSEQFASTLAASSAAPASSTASVAAVAAVASPQGQLGWQPDATLASSTNGSAGAQLLAAAESQVGQSEEPPGSNDGPSLGVYRSAVSGAQAGQPWCAYFASWAAAQAGHPLGEEGQGYGSVGEITSWAARTGRLLPASATPQPGDLILFGDRHVGVVESVNADGSLTTVEGNYSNAVSRVQRSPAEATGFVRP